jgi:hypothetical protein
MEAALIAISSSTRQPVSSVNDVAAVIIPALHCEEHVREVQPIRQSMGVSRHGYLTNSGGLAAIARRYKGAVVSCSHAGCSRRRR